ncbi:hydrogenase maturation protease [Streptomyces sp. A7024]|uniref:Hydrogenase maturation protease n=1 Tax=Streptomyces coryli TaxID=1128680 RepID=A0A6G4TRQ5_9ACTN|nr:hydrogenase maturation protease [Streptomyces coryli]NGN62472.1 hydrogenase maturation protease [Streptomyces coryli]
MASDARLVVIGVGNDFRRDDGVGWAVIRRLQEGAVQRRLPPGTALLLSDGEPGRLLTLWQDAELAVLVDAAHAHPAHPGRIHRLELDTAGLPVPSAAGSHGLGLGEAVELARALGRLPARLVVFAVEGSDGALGTGLSAPVAAAVAPVVERVAAELARQAQP